jgi:hypothetical protein
VSKNSVASASIDSGVAPLAAKAVSDADVRQPVRTGSALARRHSAEIARLSKSLRLKGLGILSISGSQGSWTRLPTLASSAVIHITVKLNANAMVDHDLLEPKKALARRRLESRPAS